MEFFLWWKANFTIKLRKAFSEFQKVVVAKNFFKVVRKKNLGTFSDVCPLCEPRGKCELLKIIKIGEPNHVKKFAKIVHIILVHRGWIKKDQIIIKISSWT